MNNKFLQIALYGLVFVAGITTNQLLFNQEEVSSDITSSPSLTEKCDHVKQKNTTENLFDVGSRKITPQTSESDQEDIANNKFSEDHQIVKQVGKDLKDFISSYLAMLKENPGNIDQFAFVNELINTYTNDQNAIDQITPDIVAKFRDADSPEERDFLYKILLNLPSEMSDELTVELTQSVLPEDRIKGYDMLYRKSNNSFGSQQAYNERESLFQSIELESEPAVIGAAIQLLTPDIMQPAQREQAISLLDSLNSNNDNLEVRSAAIGVLGQWGNSPDIQRKVEDALSEGNSKLNYAAITVIQQNGYYSDNIKQQLLKIVRDKDQAMNKFMAIQLLKKYQLTENEYEELKNVN